jgi:hypothetical protein
MPNRSPGGGAGGESTGDPLSSGRCGVHHVREASAWAQSAPYGSASSRCRGGRRVQQQQPAADTASARRNLESGAAARGFLRSARAVQAGQCVRRRAKAERMSPGCSRRTRGQSSRKCACTPSGSSSPWASSLSTGASQCGGNGLDAEPSASRGPQVADRPGNGLKCPPPYASSAPSHTVMSTEIPPDAPRSPRTPAPSPPRPDRSSPRRTAVRSA